MVQNKRGSRFLVRLLWASLILILSYLDSSYRASIHIEDVLESLNGHQGDDFFANLAEKGKAIVYIAGRQESEEGDFETIMDELLISVVSACIASPAKQQEQQPLTFVIFISERDYQNCTSSADGQECAFAPIEDACRVWQHNAIFDYRELNNETLVLWEDHTGIVDFHHHSTWYGYAKVWLPILLQSPNHKQYDVALFVDTDAIWNAAPTRLFEELNQFNKTQAIGATSTVRRPEFNQSKGFPNRINSSVLLMDMKKLSELDWGKIVRESTVANRGGIGVGVPFPASYNQSGICEDTIWGRHKYPACLMKPFVDSDKCATSRVCWKAYLSDQEFLSNIFSWFHPELLFEFPFACGGPQCLLSAPLDQDFERRNAQLLPIAQNSTVLQLASSYECLDPAIATNERLASVLPQQANEAVQWIRQNIKRF